MDPVGGRNVDLVSEHADSASFSTHLQLMGGDAELGDPSKYYPGNPRLIAPKDLRTKAASPRATSQEMPAHAISAAAAPCGAPPTPGTPVGNVVASRQRMTRASKVQLLLSGHRIL
jgi:hypothetical protein